MIIELIKSALTKEYSEELRNILDRTNSNFKSCGISVRGMCIPYKYKLEKRDALKAEAIKAEEVWDLESDIYNTSILKKSGAKFHFNLKSDVLVPLASKINTYWEGETDATEDANTSVTEQRLTAKRLSTTLNVSKLFVMQMTNAEQLLSEMIAQAINSKIESTIFSSTAQENAIANLFTADATTITDYSSICDFEDTTADIVTPTYILSKSVKNKLRQMQKSNNTNVIENGTIDGTQTVTSSNVEDNYLCYGDFSKLHICIWGDGIDVTIDPITQATQGEVRLIVNFYVDYYISNKNAIAVAKV